MSMLKTQIAIDSQASCTNKFQYHYFGPNDSIHDTMYEAFESGEPVIIDGHSVEGIDMDYYANLPEWYTDKNAWVKPWYLSDLKREPMPASTKDMDLDGEEFLKRHRKDQKHWDAFFDRCFPKYTVNARMLSHRYNQLVQNNLHLDLPDEEHTGNDHQIRVFLNLDRKKPRILAFSYSVEQYFRLYYDEKSLDQLDKTNYHSFIKELRDRCIWNEDKWDQFYLPRHYVSFPPGSMWFFNAQWISHQIIFGNKLQCYEADIEVDSLQFPELGVPNRIAQL